MIDHPEAVEAKILGPAREILEKCCSRRGLPGEDACGKVDSEAQPVLSQVHCGHTFPIAKAIRKGGEQPVHRLYAKMVLRSNGSKENLPADAYDLALYDKASSLLKQRKHAYPVVTIEPGYNTDQVLNLSSSK